jgi:hypothetical protein
MFDVVVPHVRFDVGGWKRDNGGNVNPSGNRKSHLVTLYLKEARQPSTLLSNVLSRDSL